VFHGRKTKEIWDKHVSCSKNFPYKCHNYCDIRGPKKSECRKLKFKQGQCNIAEEEVAFCSENSDTMTSGISNEVQFIVDSGALDQIDSI